MKFRKITLTPVLLFAVLPIFVGVGFQNCDNVRLELVQRQTKVFSKGEICAHPPPSLSKLHRFVFMIDNTDSMRGLDPGVPNASRRVAGLRRFIEQYKDDDNFTIAIGSLYDRQAGYLPDPTNPAPPAKPAPQGNCIFFKPRVAEDYTRLQTGLNQLDVHAADPTNNTPFKLMFDRLQTCIDTDLITSTDAQYGVVIVSDGAPTDATSQEVQDAVTKLVKTGLPAGGGIKSRVNVYFLYLDTFNASPDTSNLVYDSIRAAQRAGGLRSKAVVLDPAKEFDYSQLGLYELPKYRLKKLVVTNMTAAVGDDGLLKGDTDGDGMPDRKELDNGLNPRDYAGNGMCSDLVYFKNGGRCPSACFANLRYVDSDRDGFTDCDEENVGTSPFRIDTDADGIPDSLEYRYGLSPTDLADQLADPDEDSISNDEEVFRMTSPFHDDRTLKHKSILNVSVHESTTGSGDNCYNAVVDEIPVFTNEEIRLNTSEYMLHGKNENVIRFLLFEVPIDAPGDKPIVYEAYKTIRYEDATDGILRDFSDINTNDFTLITERL